MQIFIKLSKKEEELIKKTQTFISKKLLKEKGIVKYTPRVKALRHILETYKSDKI